MEGFRYTSMGFVIPLEGFRYPSSSGIITPREGYLNGKKILLVGYAVGILKINAIEVSVVKSYGTMLYP